jgi:hypothetical protein
MATYKLTTSNMGSKATDALIKATGVKIVRTQELVQKTNRTYNETYSTRVDVFHCNGEVFKSYSKLGHYLLKAVNEWMLVNGLVKENELESAKVNGGEAFKKEA